MSALDVVRALGGNWDKRGSHGFVRCPCHIDKTPSLKIKDGPDGDVILHCFAGCSWKDIKDDLRDRGLLPPLNGKKQQMAWGGARPKHTAQSDPAADERERIEAAKNIESARDIWRSASPAGGTLAEVYLQNRGITVPIPPTIRFAPSLKHTPTGMFLPTMVAAIQGPDRRIVGVHRTYLRADGKGKVPFSRPRMMLGSCAEGAVRLAKAGPKLAVGEGIETCLSVLQETKVPVWAALSTSGVKALILPSCVKEVILLPDGDEPGEKAAKAAAQRFISEGRTVRIARPPEGMDYNDVLVNSRRVAFVENYRKPSNG